MEVLVAMASTFTNVSVLWAMEVPVARWVFYDFQFNINTIPNWLLIAVQNIG